MVNVYVSNDFFISQAPCVPAVCELFASLPECSAEKVKVSYYNKFSFSVSVSLSHTHTLTHTHPQSFNHIIQMLSSSDNSQAKHIKRKRDEFRKLLSGIIGVSLILYHSL